MLAVTDMFHFLHIMQEESSSSSSSSSSSDSSSGSSSGEIRSSHEEQQMYQDVEELLNEQLSTARPTSQVSYNRSVISGNNSNSGRALQTHHRASSSSTSGTGEPRNRGEKTKKESRPKKSLAKSVEKMIRNKAKDKTVSSSSSDSRGIEFANRTVKAAKPGRLKVVDSSDNSTVKKQTGRPPKLKPNTSLLLNDPFVKNVSRLHKVYSGVVSESRTVGTLPNVSPDSGIQSFSGSPANRDGVAPQDHLVLRTSVSEGEPEHDGPPILENMKEAQLEPHSYPEHTDHPVLLPAVDKPSLSHKKLMDTSRVQGVSSNRVALGDRKNKNFHLLGQPKKRKPGRPRIKPLPGDKQQHSAFPSASQNLFNHVQSHLPKKRRPGRPKGSLNKKPKEPSRLAIQTQNLGTLKSKPFDVMAAQLLKQTKLSKPGRPLGSLSKVKAPKGLVRKDNVPLGSVNKVKDKANVSSVKNTKLQNGANSMMGCSPEMRKSLVTALARGTSDEPVKERQISEVVFKKKKKIRTIDNVKRKRGRPRKHPLPDDSITASKCQSSTTVTSSSSRINTSVVTISPSVIPDPKAIIVTESYSIGPPHLDIEDSESPKQSGISHHNVDDSELDSLIRSVHDSISKFPSRDLREDHTNISGSDSTSGDQVQTGHTGVHVLNTGSIHRLVPNIREPRLNVVEKKLKRGQNKVPSSISQVGFGLGQRMGSFAIGNLPFVPIPASLFPVTRLPILPNQDISVEALVRCHSGSDSLSSVQAMSSQCSAARAGSITSSSARRSTDSRSDEQSIGRRRRKHNNKAKHFKSKHKNIVDPVFVADFDSMLSDLSQLVIWGDVPESPTDPEVTAPCQPSFLLPQSSVMPFSSPAPPRKLTHDQMTHQDKAASLQMFASSKLDMITGIKEKGKRGRKKKIYVDVEEDEDEDEDEAGSEQCLPPKKRYKLLEVTPGGAPVEKRKVGRPRKYPLPGPAANTGQTTSHGKGVYLCTVTDQIFYKLKQNFTEIKSCLHLIVM